MTVENKQSLFKNSGDRIQFIRKELLHCSNRQIFFNRYSISAGTLKGWELNRYKRLPDSAVEMLFKIFEAEGIICTKEWLLYGEGKEPYKQKTLVTSLKNFPYPAWISVEEKNFIFQNAQRNQHQRHLNVKLIEACQKGFEQEVNNLIDEGANAHLLIDTQLHLYNNQENSPMHFAAKGNHLGIMRILLQRGAYIDARNRKRETPFHFACAAGDLSLVKFMLQSGAEVNAVEDEGGTPFSWACYEGRIEIIKLLENHGANINLADLQNNTPLFWACYRGHNDVVTYLLNKKADFKKLNNQGESILDISIRNGHPDTIKLLLDRMEELP